MRISKAVYKEIESIEPDCYGITWPEAKDLELSQYVYFIIKLIEFQEKDLNYENVVDLLDVMKRRFRGRVWRSLKDKS